MSEQPAPVPAPATASEQLRNMQLDPKLKVGSFVQIKGLKTAKHLNRRRGVVLETGDRIKVQIFPKKENKLVSVQPFNLDVEKDTNGPGFTPKLIVTTCCSNCSQEFPLKKLKQCSSCKLVSYCGRQCQAMNWKAHKPDCEYMRKMDEESFLNSEDYLDDCGSAELKSRFKAIKRLSDHANTSGNTKTAESILRKGIAQFKQFEESHPGFVYSLYVELAMSIMASSGKSDESVKLMEYALALQNTFPTSDSSRSYTRMHLGFLLQEQGDFEGSIKMFEDAYALDPDTMEDSSFLDIGNMHRRMGKNEKAAKAYKKFLDLVGPVDHPHHKDAVLVAAASTNLAVAMYKTSVGDMCKAAIETTKQTRIVAAAGYNKHWDKSVALVRKAVKLDPTDSYTAAILQEFFNAKKRAEEANLLF